MVNLPRIFVVDDERYDRTRLQQGFECRGRGAVRGALPVRAPKHVILTFYVSDLEYPSPISMVPGT